MISPLTVRVLGKPGANHLARAAAAFPDVAFSEDCQSPDVVWAWNLDEEQLTKLLAESSSLPRWIHIRWAGVPDWLIRVLAAYPDIPLTNGSGVHGRPIAEFVVGGLLAHYRRIQDLRAAQLRCEWLTDFKSSDLYGRTIGIVGLGDLGGSTARLLRAFGTRLIGVRRGSTQSPDVDETVSIDDLDRILPMLDVLVLATPLTPETRGLVTRERLRVMKKGAVLVNVGRGPVVDEAALVEALEDGHLGGAVLDVYTEEPLPPTSPLWKMPAVLISPHAADHTDATWERAADLFVENLGRFTRGDPLENVVDRSLGY